MWLHMATPTLTTLRNIALSGGVAVAAILVFATEAEAGLVISSASTTNVSCTSNSCVQTANPGVLNVTQLQTLLASSGVIVQGRGNTSIDAEITWASANMLTLRTPDTIVINEPIVVAGSGGLSFEFTDGFRFGRKGNVTFWSAADTLKIGSNDTSYVLVNSVATLASAIAGNPNGNYALANTYNASSDGTYASAPIPSFSGNFLALNNTISHLSIADRVAGHQVGLFGTFSGINNSISWLNLKNVHIRGGNDSQVGAIAGINRGNVVHSSVEGAVSTANTTSDGEPGAIAGGLVGLNYYGIDDSYVGGTIGGGKKAIIGGAAGEDAVDEEQHLGGSLDLVYSTAAVSLNSDTCSQCGTGSPQSSAGGLVGVNGGPAAGIYGGIILNSYATGSVNSNIPANLGGLVGFSASGSSNVISESYSTGTVSGGSGSSIGGAVGFDQGSGQLGDLYWDTTSSGITNSSQGAGNVSGDPGITGLTTAQLQSGLPAGLSGQVWGESATINGGLPYLLTLPPK